MVGIRMASFAQSPEWEHEPHRAHNNGIATSPCTRARSLAPFKIKARRAHICSNPVASGGTAGVLAPNLIAFTDRAPGSNEIRRFRSAPCLSAALLARQASASPTRRWPVSSTLLAWYAEERRLVDVSSSIFEPAAVIATASVRSAVVSDSTVSHHIPSAVFCRTVSSLADRIEYGMDLRGSCTTPSNRSRRALPQTAEHSPSPTAVCGRRVGETRWPRLRRHRSRYERQR